MKQRDWHEVLLTSEANRAAGDHLLQHSRCGSVQEDLCFGLWTQGTGLERETAIVTDIIAPTNAERNLHGNASFEPNYLTRVTRLAVKRRQGLVFMHSHLGPGWQDLSEPDIVAERDRISNTARATGKPLVGMTVGTDGHWSARVWKEGRFRRTYMWCKKVRVLEHGRLVVWLRPSATVHDRRKLRRTVESWGEEKQRCLEALRIGVVGLGSVGSVVAEGLARTGIRELLLVDDDLVETHNLDRLLNAGIEDVGRAKTDVAERAVRRAGAANDLRVINYRTKIQDRKAYAAARDCDILVSCVDSPVARDLMNRIAYRDGIPVVDGGVDVRQSPSTGKMNSARWRAHTAGPYTECLRCRGQYTSSDVMQELDGSWKNPSYIRGSVDEGGAANVFCLSLAAAGEVLGMALRLSVADDWWPEHPNVERNFVTGRTKVQRRTCHRNCTIANDDKWQGDRGGAISYLGDFQPPTRSTARSVLKALFTHIWRKRQ